MPKYKVIETSFSVCEPWEPLAPRAWEVYLGATRIATVEDAELAKRIIEMEEEAVNVSSEPPNS